MFFKRIDNSTINCIISVQDLEENGIHIDDLFSRKKEAMEYLKKVITIAARQEHFNLQSNYTSMRISVLPNHDLSLTLTEGDSAARAVKEIEKLREDLGQPAIDEIAASDQDIQEKAVTAPKPARKPEKIQGRTEYGFYFLAMTDVIRCAEVIKDIDYIESSLYHFEQFKEYDLILKMKGSLTNHERFAEFQKVILRLNEFGMFINEGPESLAYIKEHGKCIIKTGAAAKLAQLA